MIHWITLSLSDQIIKYRSLLFCVQDQASIANKSDFESTTILFSFTFSIVGAGGKVSEAVRRNVLETLLDVVNAPAADSADAASSTTRMAAAGML